MTQSEMCHLAEQEKNYYDFCPVFAYEEPFDKPCSKITEEDWEKVNETFG